MTNYTQIQKHTTHSSWGPQESGWDGPSTQSHSKPIKADDSSDIYTNHPPLPLPLPLPRLCRTHSLHTDARKGVFGLSLTSSLPNHRRAGEKMETRRKKWRGCSHRGCGGGCSGGAIRKIIWSKTSWINNEIIFAMKNVGKGNGENIVSSMRLRYREQANICDQCVACSFLLRILDY